MKMRMYPDMKVTGAGGVSPVPPKDDSTNPEVSKSQMAPLFNFSEPENNEKIPLTMNTKDLQSYAKLNNCTPKEAIKMLKALGIEVKREVMDPDAVAEWADANRVDIQTAKNRLWSLGYDPQTREAVKDGTYSDEQMMAMADEKYGNRLQNYVPEPEWKELPAPAIDIPGGMKGNMVRALMQYATEHKSGQ